MYVHQISYLPGQEDQQCQLIISLSNDNKECLEGRLEEQHLLCICYLCSCELDIVVNRSKVKIQLTEEGQTSLLAFCR